MNLLALAWGFAEATLFFVVPDVLLSVVAVRKPVKDAMVACAYALGGALAGSVVMYLAGARWPAEAAAAMDYVPAVSAEMIDGVETSLREGGLWALLAGPVKGIPYKIFGVKAGALGLPFLPFFLVSVPARLVRFVLTILAASLISHRLLSHWPERRRLRALAIFWVVFYAAFWALMPN